MRCIAIIEAQRPGLDTAILWENTDGQILAFGYENGHVKMTRPLENTSTVDNAIHETRQAFQITDATLTRIHHPSILDANAQRVLNTPRRWG